MILSILPYIQQLAKSVAEKVYVFLFSSIFKEQLMLYYELYAYDC